MNPIGVALALGAAFAWGSSFPAIAQCMAFVQPLWVTAIRFGAGLVPLLAALALLEGRKAFSFEGRWLAICATGAIGMGGYNLFAVYGIKLAGAEHAALLFAMVPLMTTMAVAIGTRTMPSATTLVCTLAALFGIALVVTGGNFADFLHSASVLGDALLFAASLCWVYYTIERAKYPGFSALRFTTLTLLAGEVVILVSSFATSAFLGVAYPSAADLRQSALLFAFVALVPVIVALICYNAAIAKLGPDRAALFINAVPVVTFAVQAALGINAPPVEYAGAAIVIAALVANNLAGRHAPAAHAHPRIT